MWLNGIALTQIQPLKCRETRRSGRGEKLCQRSLTAKLTARHLSDSLNHRTQIHKKPCFINPTSHNLLHYTLITTTATTTKVFLSPVKHWKHLQSSFMLTSIPAQFSTALHSHLCEKEVSISKLGFFEEPVLQFPSYHPLKSSIIGRFLKRSFCLPRPIQKLKSGFVPM